jgi:hypothetical protein
MKQANGVVTTYVWRQVNDDVGATKTFREDVFDSTIVSAGKRASSSHLDVKW